MKFSNLSFRSKIFLLLTLLTLIAIPITILAINQSRAPESKAAGSSVTLGRPLGNIGDLKPIFSWSCNCSTGVDSYLVRLSNVAPVYGVDLKKGPGLVNAAGGGIWVPKWYKWIIGNGTIKPPTYTYYLGWGSNSITSAPTELTPNTTYYWEVWAMSGTNVVAVSGLSQFTTPSQ